MPNWQDSIEDPENPIGVKATETHIEVVQTFEGIEGLRGSWESWLVHPDADIDDYSAEIRSDQLLRPYVIVLRKAGLPEALAAGAIGPAKVTFMLGPVKSCNPTVIVLRFVHGGFLGNLSRENSELFIKQIMGTLRQGDADVVEIEHLDPESHIYSLSRALPPFLCRDHFPRAQSYWKMALPTDSKGFSDRFSSKERKNIQRSARKLSELGKGELRFRCFNKAQDVEGMINDVESIARKSWQRHVGVGFVNNAAAHKRLRLRAEKGMLSTHVLYIGDEPCAFWIGRLKHETFYSGSLGYDPVYAKYSPGTVLLAKTIEGFCNSGTVRQINFGFGDSWYKLHFGAQPCAQASVFLFAPSVRGVALKTMRTLTCITDRLLRGFLERTALLGWVKQMWRRLGVKKAMAADSEGASHAV